MRNNHAVKGLAPPIARLQLNLCIFDKAFKKCVNKANIKDFHFHDLRHLGATKLAKQGWTVLELAAQGGWKSINMVKRYANIDAEYLADKLKQR